MITRIYKENQSLIAEGIEPNDLSQLPKSYFDGEFDGKTNLDLSYQKTGNIGRVIAKAIGNIGANTKGITLPEEF